MTRAFRRLFGLWRATVAAATFAAALTTAPAHAAPDASGPCLATVALVHDIGRDSTEFTGLGAVLHAAGYCTTTMTYGASAATPLLARTGTGAAGLAPLDDSAAELSALLDTPAGSGAAPTAIVAHGAGSLAAHYALQHGHGRAVRTFVTLGPIWNGTNLGELGTIERINRAIGTYDTVLGLERPIVDPICGGCRQLVTGSSFLAELHRSGLPLPSLNYTDILTMTDRLVVPPQASELPGIRSVTLQQLAAGSLTDHFELPDDPVVQRLTVAALRQPTGPVT